MRENWAEAIGRPSCMRKLMATRATTLLNASAAPATCIRRPTSAYVSIRQHTSAYVSTDGDPRHHATRADASSESKSARMPPASVGITSARVSSPARARARGCRLGIVKASTSTSDCACSYRPSNRANRRQEHNVSIRQHTSAYVSVRQRMYAAACLIGQTDDTNIICEHNFLRNTE